MSLKFSFPPIAGSNPHLLILGTLPGEESLRLGQYYAHPRNHFWPLIGDVLGEATPANYLDRKKMLTRHGLALWDVLKSAERIGSLDSAIRNPQVNDFAGFLEDNPSIRAIAFNGQKARDLFRRYVLKSSSMKALDTALVSLPSSSPLHTVTLETKLAAWREQLQSFILRR